MDLASSLEAKFGVRSLNKRRNLGSSGVTIGQNYDIIPSIEENTSPMRIHIDLPHDFGVISEIQKAKFGVYLSPTFLEAKFGALARISEANFGAKPPGLPNMEVSP